MWIRQSITILVLLGGQAWLVAQNNKKSAQEVATKSESYVLSDISFINDAVFMGRRDSITAPYLLPSIGYYDKSGFFVDASLSYLTHSDENRVDLALISTGYLFSKNRWSGSISGTAYFYNGDSYNVRSETIGDVSGFLGYDLKALEVYLLGSTFFNDGATTDFFAGLRVDRTFYTRDSFLINPYATLYAGSQYFYEQYYNASRLGNRKGQGQGPGNTAPTGATRVTLAEASRFKVLNVELGLPLQYYHGHFIFSFTPVLALPQSGATLTTEDAVFQENLESVFYFSVGIGYWFNPTGQGP